MNSFSLIIWIVPRLGWAVQKRFLLGADGPGDAHEGVCMCVCGDVCVCVVEVRERVCTKQKTQEVRDRLTDRWTDNFQHPVPLQGHSAKTFDLKCSWRLTIQPRVIHLESKNFYFNSQA